MSGKNAIPKILTDIARWIPWDLVRIPSGRLTKKPRGSLLDLTNCRPFDQLQDHKLTAQGGLGFVFTNGVDVPGGRVFSFDIDACRDPTTGALEPWAREVLDQYHRSYAEITPSGTGLRQFIIVANPPRSVPLIRVPYPAPTGVTKTPEIQVFGCGQAQYVTVTGNQLPGTSATLELVQDLSWLQTRYHVSDQAQAVAKLPTGQGAPPRPEQIRDQVAGTPDGPRLLAGSWAELGTPSASEAWWRLVQHVLRAAGNHGEVAVDFLLNHTVWGEGLIDSKDPGRYTRREWVTKDVARIAGKAPVTSPAQVFDDGFDPATWRPSAPAPAEIKGLVVPAAERRLVVDREPFLVHGVFPRRGLAQVFGPPGSGKTPYALSLACHVAGGLPAWFEHEIDRHGPVVYMIGEDESGILNRLDAEVETLRLDWSSFPFFVTTRSARLTDPKDVATWVQAIEARGLQQLALLVVDTQSRNFGPGNENSAEDMGIFVTHCQRIADHFGCLVLQVHHSGHREKDRGRGSSALFGALDASYEIERTGAFAVRALARKAKNWSAPDPLLGTLVVREVDRDEKDRPVTAITLRDSPPEPGEIFSVEATDDPLTRLLLAVKKLSGVPTTQSQLATAAGFLSRGRAFQDLLKRAQDFELVNIVNAGPGGRRPSYLLTEKGLMLCSTFLEQSEDIRLGDILD